jgi:tRNA threonylcarbamoyladenosine biosynthesis protein TsaE
MMQHSYTLTQDQLIELAESLAKDLHRGDIIALWGDLGTGKTTFVRALIQTLVGKAIYIPSPTFTLVQTYDTPQGEIWHCDLYRLKAPEEAFELGLEDAFHEAICLVEWPGRLENMLPEKRIDITFEIVNETTRKLTISLRESHAAIRSVLETETP